MKVSFQSPLANYLVVCSRVECDLELTFEKPLVGATKLDSRVIPKFLNAKVW